MEKFNYSARMKNLQQKLIDEEIDAIIISKPENVQYFSGFRGDSTVLMIAKNFCKLITDSRYTEQASMQAVKDFEIVKQSDGLFKKVADEIKNYGIKNFGFEGTTLTFAEYNYLDEELTDVIFDAVEVDSLRQIKDAAEVECIRRACEIADRAFAEVLNFIKAGVREVEVAAELEYYMRRLGSEKPAFDTIVASGVRGSLPHGIASDKIISAGELVTIDFGAVYNGYCSDMTRTIAVGEISGRQREIYDAVLAAQIHGLQFIKVGASGKSVDAAVRDKLKTYGLDIYFTHGLGHSLGLEIHEEPRLSRLSNCENLQANMVVTDEPGVYIPNFGGVRIEDTVLVTDNGAETLTKTSKELRVKG